jgi:hypothetical protein
LAKAADMAAELANTARLAGIASATEQTTKDIVAILKDAEATGKTVVQDGAKTVIKDGDNVVETIENTGTEIVVTDLTDIIDDADNWLQYHEDELMQLTDQVLGHTITKHIGKTDAELIQRLSDELAKKGKISISASSSFKDVQTAQKMVSKLFSENRDAVKAWIKSSNNKPFKFPQYTGNSDEILGRGITKQEYLQAINNNTVPTCKDLYNARVVLQKTTDGNNYFILTSFPE